MPARLRGRARLPAPAGPLDAGFVNAAPPPRRSRPAPTSPPSGAASATPTLTPLVERALAANGDVRIAQARLQEARATLQGADAERLPEHRRRRRRQPRARRRSTSCPAPRAASAPAALYDAGFTANWELDFFGRNRRASESAAAQVDASEAGVHAAQTAVAAEVARNYLELRGLQQRLAVARDSLVNQRESLRLTEARLDAGRGTQLDVARRAEPARQHRGDPAGAAGGDRPRRLPPGDADGAAAARRRARSSRRRSCCRSLPVTDLAALPLGTPEQLLRRRPDLVVGRAPARGGDGRHRRRHRRPLSAHQPDRPDRLRQQPLARPRRQRLAAVLARRRPDLAAARFRPRPLAHRGQRGARAAGAGQLRADGGAPRSRRPRAR